MKMTLLPGARAPGYVYAAAPRLVSRDWTRAAFMPPYSISVFAEFCHSGCHPDRGPAGSERRDLWDLCWTAMPPCPQIPRLTTLARN